MMTREIVTFASGRTAIRLTPAEGYKYVTNGTVYTEEVILGKNANINDWHDTNEELPAPESD